MSVSITRRIEFPVSKDMLVTVGDRVIWLGRICIIDAINWANGTAEVSDLEGRPYTVLVEELELY